MSEVGGVVRQPGAVLWAIGRNAVGVVCSGRGYELWVGASVRRCAIWLVVVLLAASGALGEEAAALNDAELRGKEIYQHGTSPSGGEIVAVLGADGAPIPAAALPCSGCHGSDGIGRPEGGVVPPEITWRHLTRADGARLASGRERPAYGEAHLKRAIGLGIDSGGTNLHRAMPRYRMSQVDMADLVAYLHRLGNEPEPGVKVRRLRLGTVLPAGPAGDAIEALLEARLAEVTVRGGVYGRSLELVSARVGTAAPTPAVALRELLAEGDLFALVAPTLAGFEAKAAAIAAEHEIPVIGPFAIHPEHAAAHRRWIFFLDGGLADQARGLVAHAAHDLPSHPPGLLLHPAGGDPEVLDAARDQAAKLGWERLGTLAIRAGEAADELAARILERGAEAVIYLAGGQAGGSLLSALARQAGPAPALHFYAPGASLARAAANAPPQWSNRLVLAFPSLPDDISPEARAGYAQLAASYSLPAVHRAGQLAALAAVELALEGLERAGRELRREAFIEALEGLYDHPTGLTPPLTFGPGRRVGTRGVWMVRVDPAAGTMRPDGWVELR